MNVLIVFLGAGIGGALRHGVNTAAMRLMGVNFPFGTMTVNIVGSLVMGLLGGWLATKGEMAQPTRLFLLTGVLGGFTTFSSFSLDTAVLWERGNIAGCALYVLASLVLSIGALFVGLWTVRQLP
ncbi:MAG: fluoride efflux transporter CrcB [Rhizobiaceae bacterium]|jgi:CrcB protein|nr:MAG: fluoride efflux transporter CrcB [Rhizobiaceae bacterium]